MTLQKNLDSKRIKSIRGAMLIYKPNSWFFVHIPKNGGSSFVARLKENKVKHHLAYGIDYIPIDGNEIHNQASVLQERYPVLNSCTPVCLTRNPWSRCLSLYVFDCENAVKNGNFEQDWSKRTHPRLTREGFKNSWFPNGFFRDHENMMDGINYNPHRTWKENDPQFSWMNEKTKYFKLETELKDFYNFVGIEYIDKKRNTSIHHDYHLYYDDELKEEIGKLYKQDIETFGYKF